MLFAARLVLSEQTGDDRMHATDVHLADLLANPVSNFGDIVWKGRRLR
jgi:hypothetical protein